MNNLLNNSSSSDANNSNLINTNLNFNSTLQPNSYPNSINPSIIYVTKSNIDINKQKY